MSSPSASPASSAGPPAPAEDDEEAKASDMDVADDAGENLALQQEADEERQRAAVLQDALGALDLAIEDDDAPASAVRIAAEKTRQWLVKSEARRRMELDRNKLARTARAHEIHVDLIWGAILRAGAVGKYLANRPILRVVTQAVMDLTTATDARRMEQRALDETTGAAALISAVLGRFPRDRVLQREGLRAATNLACVESVRKVLAANGCYRFAAEALRSPGLNDDRFLVEAALGAAANLAHEFTATAGTLAPGVGCASALKEDDFAVAVEAILGNMQNYALAGSVQARALNALANTMLASPGCGWDFEVFVKCVLAAMRNFSETLNIVQYGLMSIVNGLHAAARVKPCPAALKSSDVAMPDATEISAKTSSIPSASMPTASSSPSAATGESSYASFRDRARGARTQEETTSLETLLYESGCVITIKQASWTFDVDPTVEVWSREAQRLLVTEASRRHCGR